MFVLPVVNLPVTDIPSRFVTLFGRSRERQRAGEWIRTTTTTWPQVMHLICGATVIENVRDKNQTLADLLAAQLPDDRCIEELFLQVLSRFPYRGGR